MAENGRTNPVHVVELVHTHRTRLDPVVTDSKCHVDPRRIGLMEVVWKVVEAVIDTRIKIVVQLHDVLHGCHVGRGTRNTIMDIKLAQ